MTLGEEIHEMTADDIPPPVNNACVPDIYNRLDAQAIEKTKVFNSRLDFKLQVQERVILKYKTAAELRYIRERNKVVTDLRNIYRRMPNYADIPHLETKLKKLRRAKKSKSSPRHDCVFTTEPLDMKGLCTEKEDKPFCDRYFTHHLPTKSRFYKDVLGSVKKGISLPDLRPRPSDRYTKVFSNGQYMSKNRTIFPVIKSMDDNFISSRSHIADDGDDDDVETRTV